MTVSSYEKFNKAKAGEIKKAYAYCKAIKKDLKSDDLLAKIQQTQDGFAKQILIQKYFEIHAAEFYAQNKKRIESKEDFWDKLFEDNEKRRKANQNKITPFDALLLVFPFFILVGRLNKYRKDLRKSKAEQIGIKIK